MAFYSDNNFVFGSLRHFIYLLCVLEKKGQRAIAGKTPVWAPQWPKVGHLLKKTLFFINKSRIITVRGQKVLQFLKTVSWRTQWCSCFWSQGHLKVIKGHFKVIFGHFQCFFSTFPQHMPTFSSPPQNVFSHPPRGGIHW